MSFHEVACVCAGFRPSDRVRDDEDVVLWKKRLKGQWNWDMTIKVEEDTQMSTRELLRIVHGICRRLNRALPYYFAEHFEHGDHFISVSSKPEPIIGLKPKHLTNPSDDG